MTKHSEANNSKETGKTKWFRKRDLLEWSIILSVIVVLYGTGWHTEVYGRLQQVVLWTGLMQPDLKLSETERQRTSLDMVLRPLAEVAKPVNLEQFKGKVIFLNYWATWCPPCIAEMPNLQALYEQYSQNDKIRFVMVSRDQEPEKARAFIRRKEYTFPSYWLAAPRPQPLRSNVLPTTIVIDKEGKIVIKETGMANYNTMEFKNFIDTLISEKPRTRNNN